MTDVLHETIWQHATRRHKDGPSAMSAMPKTRPYGAVRGILFGLAFVLPFYAAAALIYLFWG